MPLRYHHSKNLGKFDTAQLVFHAIPALLMANIGVRDMRLVAVGCTPSHVVAVLAESGGPFALRRTGYLRAGREG